MSKTIRLGVFIWLCIFSMGAYAQNISEQARQKQELEQQIEFINKQLDSTQALQQSTVRGLNLLQQKITSRKSLLSNIETQIKQINDSIKKKENSIKVLQAEYEAMEFSYLQILYQAYTHRSRQVWVAHILASDNLRQAYRRWQYFRSYSQYLNQQAAQINQTGELLEDEISTFRKLRKETESLRGVQQKELTTLNLEERQSRQLISAMSRQEQTLKTQLQQKQREVEAINKEIERIMAEAEKSRTTASAKDVEANRVLAVNFEQNKGKLPWPLSQKVITEPYGQHNHPVLKGIKMPFNHGVGILGSRNEEVRAVFQGEVKQVFLNPLYNLCIMVQHGLYYTVYCGLGAVRVKPGDQVNVGTVLGTLAEIDGGYSLHFELRKGIDSQNPEQWLQKR